MNGSVEYLDNATLITPYKEQTVSNYQAAKNKLLKGSCVAHKHVFDSITGKKVYGTDKVILFRVCSCSQEKAFEMGTRDAMVELYMRLHKKETNR